MVPFGIVQLCRSLVQVRRQTIVVLYLRKCKWDAAAVSVQSSESGVVGDIWITIVSFRKIMEGKNFVPNNTSADLMQSWHIPRPTLARSSNSSQGSTSGSTNSTQSARSGSLLLTAANLAQIHHATKQDSSAEIKTTRDENIKYYLEQSNNQLSIPISELKKPSDPDSVSIASSMHFTVVNVNSRPQVKTRSFCKKHQLTVLVVTMSAIFTIGIIAAIFLLEMRARTQPPH